MQQRLDHSTLHLEGNSFSLLHTLLCRNETATQFMLTSISPDNNRTQRHPRISCLSRQLEHVKEAITQGALLNKSMLLCTSELTHVGNQEKKTKTINQTSKARKLQKGKCCQRILPGILGLCCEIHPWEHLDVIAISGSTCGLKAFLWITKCVGVILRNSQLSEVVFYSAAFSALTDMKP